MKPIYFLFPPVLILLLLTCLNYRQLYAAWAIHSETHRLEAIAQSTSVSDQNPAPLEDTFTEELSPEFWKFSIINGAGQVNHGDAWHAVAMTVLNALNLHHIHDSDFSDESTKPNNQPAAERYNNVTLIGASGFQPTPSQDVVLKFSSRVSENFYGTAGVIFQPVGTLQQDGFFAKPFDMFGFSVAGNESSIMGVNGSLCYLALNWMPVEVNALSVDTREWHDYEIRLRWVSNTRWLGTVSVDDSPTCEIPMPAFGPVEVHVWSDNALVRSAPRRWWEIAPSMDLDFQNGGDKEFSLGYIRVSAEAR